VRELPGFWREVSRLGRIRDSCVSKPHQLCAASTERNRDIPERRAPKVHIGRPAMVRTAYPAQLLARKLLELLYAQPVAIHEHSNILSSDCSKQEGMQVS
jgi:hypothetical protein